MPKVRPETLNDVAQALQRYIAEVESLDIPVSTKGTYIHYARLFGRWLADDFEPGGRNKLAR